MKLEIQNGSFAYADGRTILRDISLCAESGDLIAVLGANGAGKTTLLRCLLGFLKWTQGDTLLDGKPLRQIPPRTRWQKIAYVPQAKHFTSASRVEDAILLGRNSHLGVFSQPKQEDYTVVSDLMCRLGIEKLRGKSCSQISGGELQMVLIARALAAKPQILILDEPESNLDFRNQLIVLKTMSELTKSGMTCIFNTHYPDHALRHANKALMLRGDGTAIFGDTKKIVTQEQIRAAFGVETAIAEIPVQGDVLQSILPIALTDESAP